MIDFLWRWGFHLRLISGRMIPLTWDAFERKNSFFLLIYQHTVMTALRPEVIGWLEEHAIPYRVKLGKRAIVVDRRFEKFVLDNLVAALDHDFLVYRSNTTKIEEWSRQNGVRLLLRTSNSDYNRYSVLTLEDLTLLLVTFAPHRRSEGVYAI